MSKDRPVNRNRNVREDREARVDEELSREMLEETAAETLEDALNPPEEQPTKNVAEFLFVPSAIEQLRIYKKEAMAAFVALLVFSTATLLSSQKTERLLTDPFDPNIATGISHPVLPVVLALIPLALSLVALIWALFSLARPLRKRTVTLRIALLVLGFLFVTAVKSFALGHFARLLFAGDVTRFDLTKTGVDHASALLAVLFATAFYVFLASCLKEEKLTFAGFAKSFGILFVWVATIHLVKLVVLFVFGTSLGLSALVAVLSTLVAVWYMALALALQKDAAQQQEDSQQTPALWDSEGAYDNQGNVLGAESEYAPERHYAEEE
ncbi:MAG: hypothetical protein FWC99_03390 [Coriobacteriia bacterium]|nr:hypothetical protein [Coriobacteriia bacterium]